MADFVEEEAGEEPQEEPQEGGEAAGSDDDNAGLPSDEEEASGSGSDSDSSAEGSDDEASGLFWSLDSPYSARWPLVDRIWQSAALQRAAVMHWLLYIVCRSITAAAAAVAAGGSVAHTPRCVCLAGRVRERRLHSG